MRSRTWRSTRRDRMSSGMSMSCWTKRWRSPSPPAIHRRSAGAIENRGAGGAASVMVRRLARQHGAPFVRHQQVVHVVRMLFFDLQDTFQHRARSRIVIAEIADELAVMIHGDPFCNEILLDHFNQII